MFSWLSKKGAVGRLKACLQKGADEADVNLQLSSYFKAIHTPASWGRGKRSRPVAHLTGIGCQEAPVQMDLQGNTATSNQRPSPFCSVFSAGPARWPHWATLGYVEAGACQHPPFSSSFVLEPFKLHVELYLTPF